MQITSVGQIIKFYSIMDNFVEFVNLLTVKIESIHDYNTVHIVLGNESCDLDSTISSLTLAYLLYQHKYCSSKSVLVLPILNVIAEEFPLRTENVFLLKRIGIDPDKLVFRDTIDLEQFAKETVLTVSLVDHHILSPKDFFLFDAVVEIFDHRPIDTSVTWPKSVVVHIETVGSCCTLIAQEYANLIKDIPKSAAKVLHDTIIFDTVALREDVGKAKQSDHEAIALLKAAIKWDDLKTDASIFDELWSAHNDVSTLSSYQIMLKDLKIVGDIFIPGLPMLCAEFLKRQDFEECVSTFYDNKKAKLIVIMGLQYVGEVKKDMAVYSLPENVQIQENLLEKLLGSNLELVSVDVPNKNIIYFKQNNAKLSRKQVMPIIKTVVQ